MDERILRAAVRTYVYALALGAPAELREAHERCLSPAAHARCLLIDTPASLENIDLASDLVAKAAALLGKAQTASSTRLQGPPAAWLLRTLVDEHALGSQPRE